MHRVVQVGHQPPDLDIAEPRGGRSAAGSKAAPLIVQSAMPAPNRDRRDDPRDARHRARVSWKAKSWWSRRRRVERSTVDSTLGHARVVRRRPDRPGTACTARGGAGPEHVDQGRPRCPPGSGRSRRRRRPARPGASVDRRRGPRAPVEQAAVAADLHEGRRRPVAAGPGPAGKRRALEALSSRSR